MPADAGASETLGPVGGAMPTELLLDRSFAAVVFDWDGTAVPDRRAPADGVRERIERLCAAGIHIAVVSGTNLGNVDGQLRARPVGPGRLYLALNRGSELYEVGRQGPRLVRRRDEDPPVSAGLDAVAAQVVSELGEHGLPVTVTSRLNRRKIDLIPAWSDPPKSRFAELEAAVTDRLRGGGLASIGEVVRLVERVAADVGLDPVRVTSDAKHVEIGVTDKADSVRDLLDLLSAVGVGPGLVLLAGDEFGDVGEVTGSDARMMLPDIPGLRIVSVGVEPGGVPAGVRHLPGGPPRFLALLDEQLDRMAARRVPDIDHDPRWGLQEQGVDPVRHRVTETLFTVASGGVATRGSVEELSSIGQPMVAATGVYAGDESGDGLLPGPLWTNVAMAAPPTQDVRTLDLRTGVLHREEVAASGIPLRSVRFASLGDPGVMALRVEAGSDRMPEVPDPAGPQGPGLRDWQTTTGRAGGGIGVLVSDSGLAADDRWSLERLAAVDAEPNAAPSRRRAGRRLTRARDKGFDRLLAEHREAWARRWDAVDVRIPGSPVDELALRFVLFQLWNLTGTQHDLAVGARGISGPGYSGHVFWDADAFVLPALMTIDPTAAARMVDYRVRRLDAARDFARAHGCAGARFPWESARTGSDVTPSTGFLGGEQIEIRTGVQEEHVTADVAWSVLRWATWAGTPLSAEERVLLVETARYWASRCRVDKAGRAHLDQVIGPDEYHEGVDDNAFTNVMARWNLLHAAQHAGDLAPVGERDGWRDLAHALVDLYDAESGLYEQFRGYFLLEPLLVRDIAPPPVAADVLLGRGRIARSQVIKQPDVLMLHQMVPGSVVAGSLRPNLAFYGPRTAQGSSLSPAVMAQLLARDHQPDQALELLRIATSLDLDDRAGTAASGSHVGAAGGAWQALVFGFLGAEVRDGILHLDPVLPAEWPELEVRFRCLGRDVRVRVDAEGQTVSSSEPVRVATGPGPVTHVAGHHRETRLTSTAKTATRATEDRHE